jgi:hypothetical protein
MGNLRSLQSQLFRLDRANEAFDQRQRFELSVFF